MPLPSPLLPGATLGIIAPASAPTDLSKLEAGLATLRERGFQLIRGRSSLSPRGYLSGTDAERLDELNTFLRRPDIDALVCVRGGYGCLRLLSGIDYEAARAHPKLLIGYSDITALHLALYHRSGWRGLSGPMAAVEWPAPDTASEELFWSLARGGTPSLAKGPAGGALRPVQAGTAEGVLLGGNLAVLTRLVGTPYLPPLDGAILFIEDIGEAPYRLDGMLAHLKLAGLLERLGGLVAGGFTDWEPEPDAPPGPTHADVIADYAACIRGPVAADLAYGHFPVKHTLPVGVRARLRVAAGAAHLDVLEPATSTLT